MTQGIYNYYRSDRGNERITSTLATGRAQMGRAVVPLSFIPFIPFTLYLFIPSFFLFLFLSPSSLSSPSPSSFLLLSLTLLYFTLFCTNSSFFLHMDPEDQSPNARPDSPPFSSQSESDAPMRDSPPPSSSVPASHRHSSIASTVQPSGHYYHNNRNSLGQFTRASTGATAPAYITVQEETLLSVFTGRNILGAYSAMQAARAANASAFQYSFIVPAPPNLALRPNQGIDPTPPHRTVNLSIPIDPSLPILPQGTALLLPQGTALLTPRAVLQDTSSSHSLATTPGTIQQLRCIQPAPVVGGVTVLYVIAYPTSYYFPTNAGTTVFHTALTYQVSYRRATDFELEFLRGLDPFSPSNAPPPTVDWTQTLVFEFWIDITILPGLRYHSDQPANSRYFLYQSWNRADCHANILYARLLIQDLDNCHDPPNRVSQTPIPVPTTNATTAPPPPTMPSSSPSSSPSALLPPSTLPPIPSHSAPPPSSPAPSEPSSSSSSSSPRKPPSPPSAPPSPYPTRSRVRNLGYPSAVGSTPVAPSTRSSGRARGRGRGSRPSASSASDNNPAKSPEY